MPARTNPLSSRWGGYARKRTWSSLWSPRHCCKHTHTHSTIHSTTHTFINEYSCLRYALPLVALTTWHVTHVYYPIRGPGPTSLIRFNSIHTGKALLFYYPIFCILQVHCHHIPSIFDRAHLSTWLLMASHCNFLARSAELRLMLPLKRLLRVLLLFPLCPLQSLTPLPQYPWRSKEQ